MVEGMSYGCIPIATTHSAAPELLNDSEMQNFIFEPGNIIKLKEIFFHLASAKRTDLERLSLAAQEISKKYSYANFAEKLISTIRDSQEDLREKH